MRVTHRSVLYTAVALTVSAMITVAAIAATSFVFRIQSKPLPGYTGGVDAVTKASNIIDSLFVTIDSIPAGDLLKEIEVRWGDSTSKVYAGNKFTVGPKPVALTHWYVRVDTAAGICTTKVIVRTNNALIRDTSFAVRVLSEEQVAGAVRRSPARIASALQKDRYTFLQMGMIGTQAPKVLARSGTGHIVGLSGKSSVLQTH